MVKRMPIDSGRPMIGHAIARQASAMSPVRTSPHVTSSHLYQILRRRCLPVADVSFDCASRGELRKAAMRHGRACSADNHALRHKINKPRLREKIER